MSKGANRRSFDQMRTEALPIVSRLLALEYDELEQDSAVERLSEIFGHRRFITDMYFSDERLSAVEIVDRSLAYQSNEEEEAEQEDAITEAIREALRALQTNDK